MAEMLETKPGGHAWGPSGTGSRMDNESLIFTITGGDALHYRTWRHVRENLTAYQSLHGSLSTDEQINPLIQNLEGLYKELITQEQTFYGKCQCTGLDDLYNRTKEWRTLGSPLVDTFNAKHIFTLMNHGDPLPYLSQEEIAQSLLSELKPKLLENTEGILKKSVRDSVANLMATRKAKTAALVNFVFDIKTDKDNQVKQFKGTVANGIQLLIDVTYDEGSQKLQLTPVTDPGKIATRDILERVGKHILKARGVKSGLNADATSNNGTAVDNDRESFYAAFRTVMSTQGMPQNIIDKCIEMLKKPNLGFTFEFTLNGIKGLLGELYWYGVFSHTFNSLEFIPTGKWTNEKGWQLPFDLVLASALNDSHANIGFQVKNWHTSTNEGIESYTTQGKSNLLGNFLENNGLSSLPVGQILARMFGSAAYNQPNGDWADDNFADYSSFYTTQLLPTAMNTQMISDILQYYIINVSHIARADVEKNEKHIAGTYRNTFWLINDKIIPSSALVSAMLDALRNKQSTSYVRFFATSLDMHVDTTSGFWPERVESSDYSDLAMANMWSIKYQLEFNLTALINQAKGDAAKRGTTAPTK